MIIGALLMAAALLIGGHHRALGRRAGVLPGPVNVGGRTDAARDPFAAASALDVFAVCLSAGMAVPAAAAVTSEFAPPALSALLVRAADLLALGADAETAWQVPDEHPDDSSIALARLARRSAASGAALSAGVTDIAEQQRQRVTDAATAAAERAGVLIAGPLGLCFLPAFLCLGVVPVVAGLAGEIFGSGPL